MFIISKINDIDWNKQVQDLDYLCEVEESQSAKVCSERNKIDIQNLDNCKPMMNDAPVVQFSTPKKKSKKDRKSSSITDATNSNKVDENEKEAVILCSSIPNIVAPKIDLYFRDYTYEAYNIDSDDKFCYNSFEEFSERLPENIRENILEFNKSECSELEYSHENLQEKKHGDFIHGLYFSNPHTVMKQCYEDDFDGLFNQHQSHLL